VVLDLRQKWDYFELGIEQVDWTHREVEVAQEMVQQLWSEDYKESGLNCAVGDSGIGGIDTIGRRVSIIDLAEEHYRQRQAKRRRITPGMYFPIILLGLRIISLLTPQSIPDDAYTRYIQSLPEPNIDSPFQYWVNGVKSTNPLVRMALDIFSIPAMSADPEWLFSSSKHVLRDTRNRLKCEALEALKCLKSWAKEGVLLSNFYRFNTFPEPDYIVEDDLL